MKIKTIRPHANSYGERFEKKKGDIYDHPDPEGLIAEGIANAVDKTGGRKGSGKGAAGTENGDGKAGQPKGDEGRSGAGSGKG